MNLTWHCEICHQKRLDEFISVLTYSPKNLPNLKRNLKYCNDNPNCLKKAQEKANKGGEAK